MQHCRTVRILVASALVVQLAVLVTPPGVDATNHQVHIDEVMAGANGDANVQFVEMRMADSSQNVLVRNGLPCAKLVFFDANDNQVGEFFFDSIPPGGFRVSFLIGPQAFANLSTTPAPDFIMSPNVVADSGKVCYRGDPNNQGCFGVNLCLSYGNFQGSTEFGGAPAPSLPITRVRFVSS